MALAILLLMNGFMNQFDTWLPFKKINILNLLFVSHFSVKRVHQSAFKWGSNARPLQTVAHGYKCLHEYHWLISVTHATTLQLVKIDIISCGKNVSPIPNFLMVDGRFVAMVTKDLQTLNLKFEQVMFNSLVLTWEKILKWPLIFSQS